MSREPAVTISYGDIVSNPKAHGFMLNVYRYNENTRALRLSKFAELVRDPSLKMLVAKHFADEAKHAFLFTKCLQEIGGDIYPLPQEIDYLYKLESDGIGVSLERMLCPQALSDDEIVRFLVADEFLEERGVKTLSQHLTVTPQGRIHSMIDSILRDEKSHVSYINHAVASFDDPHLKRRVAELYSEYRNLEEAIHKEHWQTLCRRVLAFF